MAYTPYMPTAAPGAWDPFNGFDASKVPYSNDWQTAAKNWGMMDPRTQGQLTRSTAQYQGELTRGAMGQGFTNLNTGLQNLGDDMQQYAQYGGMFGDKNAPTYSPQSKNGYGTMWGNNNPFKIGSF